MPPNSSADPLTSENDERGGQQGSSTNTGENAMAVIETLGLVLGLAVMALMALASTLVSLNDRFPPSARTSTTEEAVAAVAQPVRERQVSSVRTSLLGHYTPAHRQA
jgi:hypothetical protein